MLSIRKLKRRHNAIQNALWAPVWTGMRLMCRDAKKDIKFTSGPGISDMLKQIEVNICKAALLEDAKREFVCVKVSDGTVIDTFDSREDAQALVDKHVRGKKAKLTILETA